MKFEIVTIFPHIFDSYLQESLLAKAQKKGILKINFHNLRKYTKDKHKKVDDRPFGGGPGMVIKIKPIVKCLEKIKQKNKSKVILLSPRGKNFNQAKARKYSKLDQLILICGRYEGIDERIKKFIDEQISIGDFVMSGGELPAMVIVETISRLIPGVLGNKQSINDQGYPVYTKPRVFRKLKVPKVFLSGDHAKIKQWKEKHKN